MRKGLPKKQGLYDPRWEHDSCGVGFVVDIKGRQDHRIVQNALDVLLNLRHRGATGFESNTGDGSGILLQTPHRFLKKVLARDGIQLPPHKEYGVGMVYLPTDRSERRTCEKIFEQIVTEEGQSVLGWRTVPSDHTTVGETARSTEPMVRQIFILRNPQIQDDGDFERKLYVIRKRTSHAIRYAGGSGVRGGDAFYISSLSYKTIVYKGMLMSEQLETFFPDISDPDVETALAIVHSRFSTNTFPTWARSHPFRYIAHNGEINTLRGNVNWMNARQSQCASDLLGSDLKKILPIIRPDGSDSAMFDNCLEFLVMTGRSLPHAMMMMIPEPWSNNPAMSDERKAFYEFHSYLMEPWDGPASIAFSDGIQVGAVLDRNGLRPARYYMTRDDRVVMASEVGVLDIAPEDILQKGRLQPGKMLLIDTEKKRIIEDEEIKEPIIREQPYRIWINENRVNLEDLPTPSKVSVTDHATVLQRQKVFGYTSEDQQIILGPMASTGVEPTGSMGNDTPLAVLSDKPQLLYNYFKQLFAQVTNPPIDCIRENIVMSSEVTIGPEGNLLKPGPGSCRQIRLKSPILTNEEMARFEELNHTDFRPVKFPILYPVHEGGKGLKKALDNLFSKASQAIRDGFNIIILSDRGLDQQKAPIPALLAVSGLHHHLIREGTRTRVGLVLESGEPREVHHFSLLVGYGVGAVNPYLAFETLDDMIGQGLLTELEHARTVKNFVKAASKGLLKVISKMGISTVQSYGGAQIFEAVGLAQPLIDTYFTDTPSRIQGIGLDEIAEEVRRRHEHAYDTRPSETQTLEAGGQYQWRQEGENHLFNPETIYKLQLSCRANDYAIFKEYSSLINDQSERRMTLRGLFKLKQKKNPIPLADVEPAASIMKRFKTGAMSYGSISQEAHESLAIAMNRIGGKSNTGEGGEDPARFQRDPVTGETSNSAIKQVASGRFGVTSHYLMHAQEIQIKMAQGAKPGEGGQLPGSKTYPWIAKVRHATPGVGLISPPPHHDIYSIEDLAELIHDLKNANPSARINVKLVAEVGVGTIAAGVAKAHADVVLISGHDGGTGASPLTSIKHAGLPWELGLAETHQTLVLNNLRDRIVVETDGQLKTGRDVVIAALLGAEEFGFATAPLVVLGCLMMRVCHLDTCPVGIATQNPELRKKFTGDPAHVVNFMRFIAEEMREIMASLGIRTVNELIGRTDLIGTQKAVDHWKAHGIDLAPILHQPEVPSGTGCYCQTSQDHRLDRSLDHTTLMGLCQPALQGSGRVQVTLPIRNTNRVVGTLVGSEVTRRYGSEGLPDDTIEIHFQGSAGQSFGAFIPRGMTLILEGDSNDYLGKGLSGGKIIVYPPRNAPFAAEENIITGNVALYGATSGEAYVRGIAGERFCIRNSGARAVVEGVGDHGCEYMTGGRVVILGPTGRNFAAGMSGGIAYVLDEGGTFPVNCNKEMVDIEGLSDPVEKEEVFAMIERHAKLTGSSVAHRVLDRWEEIVDRFVKVMPRDYKRALQAISKVRKAGLVDEDQIMMAAFEENKKDLARIAGN